MNLYDNNRNGQATINSVVLEESLERNDSKSTGGLDTANITPESTPVETMKNQASLDQNNYLTLGRT